MTALCECGCGQQTTVPTETNRRLGRIKGEPMRFVRGHNTQGRQQPCTVCNKRPAGDSSGVCKVCRDREDRHKPENCRYCGQPLGLPDEGRSHDRCLASRRDRWNGYRDRIIDAYGGACACCGVTDRPFLTIDHVNGNGGLHRASLGGGNRRTFLDIIHANFPPDYQVLCFNCNLGRARNGGACPHVAAEPAVAS